MEPLKLRGNDTADPVVAKVMRHFAAVRRRLDREQAAQRVVRAHDAAWRLRLLGTLGALLDALRRGRMVLRDMLHEAAVRGERAR